VTPEDDPRAAFARVFKQRSAHADREGHAASIIDNALVELNQLKRSSARSSRCVWTRMSRRCARWKRAFR